MQTKTLREKREEYAVALEQTLAGIIRTLGQEEAVQQAILFGSTIIYERGSGFWLFCAAPLQSGGRV